MNPKIATILLVALAVVLGGLAYYSSAGSAPGEQAASEDCQRFKFTRVNGELRAELVDPDCPHGGPPMP